jgi:hypothetical protein
VANPAAADHIRKAAVLHITADQAAAAVDLSAVLQVLIAALQAEVT